MQARGVRHRRRPRDFRPNPSLFILLGLVSNRLHGNLQALALLVRRDSEEAEPTLRQILSTLSERNPA